MPDPTKEAFDLDKLAEEIAGMEPTADEDAEIQEEAAEEVETEEAAEVAVDEDEDDHEKFAQSFSGKAIPQEAFLKRLAREREKRQGVEKNYSTTQAELEALRKAAPLKQEDLEKFERLQGVFGNLDKASREMPWLTPLLLAVGAGKQPDWDSVQKGLTDFVSARPKGDPILYQQQQEIRMQLEELQQDKMNGQAVTHVQEENSEIAKLFGPNDPKSNPEGAEFWSLLNEQAMHAFNGLNPKSLKEAPNRVLMAKRMMKAATAYHQKQLKAQLPPPKRAQAGLNAGPGNAAAPKDKKAPPKDINSQEFAQWLLSGS